MLRESGHLTYEKHGVNCVYEIHDDYCVSREEAEKKVERISEIVYPHLLEIHKRKLAEVEANMKLNMVTAN